MTKVLFFTVDGMVFNNISYFVVRVRSRRTRAVSFSVSKVATQKSVLLRSVSRCVTSVNIVTLIRCCVPGVKLPASQYRAWEAPSTTGRPPSDTSSKTISFSSTNSKRTRAQRCKAARIHVHAASRVRSNPPKTQGLDTSSIGTVQAARELRPGSRKVRQPWAQRLRQV